MSHQKSLKPAIGTHLSAIILIACLLLLAGHFHLDGQVFNGGQHCSSCDLLHTGFTSGVCFVLMFTLLFLGNIPLSQANPSIPPPINCRSRAPPSFN
jgi:hypothetical protein